MKDIEKERKRKIAYYYRHRDRLIEEMRNRPIVLCELCNRSVKNMTMHKKTRLHKNNEALTTTTTAGFPVTC